MRVVDLDGVMFVPVVDETHGGAVVEIKMTVGEFFEKCCQGFEPETIDAIPVGWLRQEAMKDDGLINSVIRGLLMKWQKEQEAQD